MSYMLQYESLFVRRAPNPRARVRLFCLPHAGAGVSFFNRWPEFAAPDLEIVAIQLPGREDRAFEQPFTGIAPLVRTIAQAARPYLGSPFAVFGHNRLSIKLDLSKIR